MFDSTFYESNRTRLTARFSRHILVIPANSMLQSSADVAFPFRQDSNFWYLTGIDEPNLVLLIDTKNGESTLLLPEQNDYQKAWEGENKHDELKDISGIVHFGSIKSLKKRLKTAKDRGLKIGYLPPLDEIVQPFGFYSNPARRVVEKIIKAVDPEPEDIRTHLGALRQVKQPEEIAAIQEAVDATARTLIDVKRRIDEFSTEKDIERAISAGFYANGTDGHAYEPIVASGKNAATIHYQKNDASLAHNELLLLDVGALSQKYAADISRTWAIGKISQRHKDIYQAVLTLQLETMNLLKPGITIRQLQEKVEKKAQTINKKLGITVERYPHLISHYLGLDVHDAGNYDAPLEENTVITVEPGIYLADEGIGVRIEDDIVITKNGMKNLSEKIPKDL